MSVLIVLLRRLPLVSATQSEQFKLSLPKLKNPAISGAVALIVLLALVTQWFVTWGWLNERSIV